MTNALNGFMAGRQFRQQEEDRRQQNALMQEQRGLQNTQNKIQGALMDGDREGAQSMARASNNADVMAGFQAQISALDDSERQRQQQIFGAVGNLANVLRGVPVEQRSVALRSEAPRLMQLGVPAEEIQRYDALLSDPNSSDAVLAALSSRVLEAQSVFDAYAPQMQAENEVMGSYQDGRYTQGPANPNAAANRAIEQQNANSRTLTAQTGAAREQRQANSPAPTNLRNVGNSVYDMSDPSNPRLVLEGPEFSSSEARQFRNQFTTLDAVSGALEEYRTRLGEVGTNVLYNPREPDQRALESARMALLLQTKELFNLGVLNGPDLELMERMIGDPQGIGAIGQSTGSLMAQLDIIDSYIGRARNQIPADFRGQGQSGGEAGEPSIEDLVNQYAPE